MTMLLDSARSRERVVYGLIVLLVVGCYSVGLNSPAYLYDDETLRFGTWPIWDEPGGVLRIWSGAAALDAHYRPVSDTVLWAAHQLWGEQVLGYRLLNLGAQLITVVLAIRVLRRLRIPHAEWAGLFIAIHPVAVQPVLWMVQTRGLLADLFIVAAVGALVRQHLQQSWRWGMLSLGCLALALLSKTTAASFPVLVLVLALLFRVRPTRQTWIFIAASFVLTGAIGLIDRQFVLDVFPYAPPQDRFSRTSVSILQYLRNFMAPYPLGLFYDAGVSVVEWICGGVVVGSIIALLVTKRRRRALELLLVIVAFVVSVAPAMVGHIGWAMSPAQDRYQHLGTFIVVPYLAYALEAVVPSASPSRRTVTAAIAALAMALSIITINQVRAYANPNRLYPVSMRIAPHSPTLVLYWARSLQGLGDYERARRILLKHAPELRAAGLYGVVEHKLAASYLVAREYARCLNVLRSPNSRFWPDAVMAAIFLEAPDPKFRHNARGAELVAVMETAHMARLDFGLYGRPRLQALQASVHAAWGRFDEAERLIEAALADPALAGRGYLRKRIRDDLAARLRSYRTGVIHTAPESQLLWEEILDLQ
jgi:hypothetical protein